MKKVLLAGVSLGALGLASGVQAADLAARPVYSKAPVAAVPTWSWAGFYVGANVGGASARTNVSNPDNNYVFFPRGSSFNSNQTGIIGGLEAGYNWQFNSLVVGVEGDISAASLGRRTLFGTANPPDTFNASMTALGTVRGRIGWAFDRLLIYGTGGVAFANLKDQYVSLFPFTAAAGSSATGWTAGGGIEYAFWGNWTAKAEYLHVGFPNRSALVAPFNNPYLFVFKDSVDIGRVGINYKF